MRLYSLLGIFVLTMALSACSAPLVVSETIASATPSLASATSVPNPDFPVHTPQRLGIYYGWPSAVVFNEGSVASPSEPFAQFSVVVLGAGLANPEHPDHAHTQALVAALLDKNVEVYGYVGAGISTQSGRPDGAELHRTIAQWKQMNATGIFLDESGYEFAGQLDYPAYRQRLVTLVELAHNAGLQVFINAWNPDDLFQRTFANWVDLPIPALQPSDIVLAESWLVSDGHYVNEVDWYRKAEKLALYRREKPFRLACVATGPDHPGIEQSSKFQVAYWAAVMFGCNLFQYTNSQYSAVTTTEGNHLYIHAMPATERGDRFIGPVTVSRQKDALEFTRPTQLGEIVVGIDRSDRGYGFFRVREIGP